MHIKKIFSYKEECKKKKLGALAFVALLSASMVGCKKGDDNSIKILNFKPELAESWGNLQAAVKADLGLELKVETAANGQYESTLRKEVSTDESPDIFQINGPIGYGNWSDYIAD